jgi:hypothetical protein
MFFVSEETRNLEVIEVAASIVRCSWDRRNRYGEPGCPRTTDLDEYSKGASKLRKGQGTRRGKNKENNNNK